jgi:hypothetical protein
MFLYAISPALGTELYRKNSGIVGKFRPWELENGRKKFRYGGKFPSGGKKTSYGAWNNQDCGIRRI